MLKTFLEKISCGNVTNNSIGSSEAPPIFQNMSICGQASYKGK